MNPSHVGLEKLGQYHGCWCPGSLLCQDINSQDTDQMKWGYSCFAWDWISMSCNNTVWELYTNHIQIYVSRYTQPLKDKSFLHWFYFRTHKNRVAFFFFLQHWDGTGTQNPSLTRTWLKYIFNAMVADDLATSRQGISSHRIDVVIPEYPCFSRKGLIAPITWYNLATKPCLW